MVAGRVMPANSAPDAPLHNLLFPIPLYSFTLEGFMKTPPGYEKKFAGFIQMCSEANAKGITEVIVSSPSQLGDTYDELIESLSRLARAGLRLHIAVQTGKDIYHDEETGSD
jgi:hypothetical protein